MQIIDAYLEHLRRLARSPDTIKLRRTVLRRLDADLPYGIVDTTTEEIAQWLFRDDLGTNSIATYSAAIRDFYAWAA
ncbi:MAG: integrase/recombinase XerC, partial [Actinomycetota bacterium]|nr:integrase/recombinase XerC [Actinomycetota bacterium]